MRSNIQNFPRFVQEWKYGQLDILEFKELK